MRILVTGGAGYIGSQTVRSLRRRGHLPIVLDTLEHGHRAAVEDAELVVGSVADRELVHAILVDGSVDAVIHFAARKAAGESVDDPSGYFETNVGHSLALLTEIERAGIGVFVYSSSCAIYGDPVRVPVDEATPPRPTSPYGESKLLVERALPWYERRGIRHASLRYFNAAGAELDGSHGEVAAGASNLVPLVVGAVLGQSPPLTIFGTDYPTPDGTAIRDYVHVVDLAAAHVRALEWLVSGRPSLTVNLGTGRGASVLEVIAAVERATGARVPREAAGRRAGDPAAIWADVSLADASLGWRAEMDLDEIARSAVRWQADHPYGYDTPAAVPADVLPSPP
ncbi:MAG: UDP-glucose 4-epimerase GalE [Candidatus Limnocylindrales bacterium]